MNAMASARLYFRICENDFRPELMDNDDAASFQSFIDSISETGEVVTEKTSE